MVSLISICLSAHLFLLCAVMALTVVVHSFVADSSLLDCCDLVVFFPPYICRQATVWVYGVVSAVLFLSFGVSCLLAWLGQPFFVCHQLLWFGLSFIWCQLFACLIRAAIFSFATNICGLVFLSLPQASVVCSYFFLSQSYVYSFFLTRPFLLQAFVLDFVFAFFLS